MESDVERSVLKGRPRGGCEILLKLSLSKMVTFYKAGERFCIVVLGRAVLCLPTAVNQC